MIRFLTSNKLLATALGGVLLSALGACGGDASATQPPGSDIPATARLGKPAPDFELTYLNHEGGSTLHDLKGRTVLIEFWRTW